MESGSRNKALTLDIESGQITQVLMCALVYSEVFPDLEKHEKKK